MQSCVVRSWRVRASVLALLVFVCGGAFAASSNRSIVVEDAWVRPPSKTSPVPMAFFEVFNRGDKADRLISVSSPAGRATLNVLRGGLSPRVELVRSITIPASGRVTLRPGEYYAALVDNAEVLRPGMSLTLSLQFETAGSFEIEAKVTNQLLGNFR